MSERRMRTSEVAVIIMILFIGGSGFGYGEYYNGKRAADRWYAAHPVMKEVSTVPTINGASSIIVRPGQMCAFVSFDKNLHYEAICQPDPDAPALPAKPASELKWGDWFYGKHTDYKIATVDPCDIGMHAAGWGWGEVDCEKNEAKPAKGKVLHSSEGTKPAKPALIGEAASPLNLKSGWTYKNILVDEENKTVQGRCPSFAIDPRWFSPPDEAVQKAACEKEGGYWDHMDGSACYATNPEICTSHCDPKMPASQP